MKTYKHIAHIAEAKRITLDEIERRAKLKKGTIEEWKSRKPTLPEVMRTAGALRMDISDFLPL